MHHLLFYILYHIKRVISFFVQKRVTHTSETHLPAQQILSWNLFFKMCVHEDEEDSWKRLHRNITFVPVLWWELGTFQQRVFLLPFSLLQKKLYVYMYRLFMFKEKVEKNLDEERSFPCLFHMCFWRKLSNLWRNFGLNISVHSL